MTLVSRDTREYERAGVPVFNPWAALDSLKRPRHSLDLMQGHRLPGRSRGLSTCLSRAWVCANVALITMPLACGGTNPNEPSDVPVVTSPPLSFLEIFPAPHVAKIGDTLEPRVTARDVGGADVANLLPAYASSNPAAVTVEAGRHLRAWASELLPFEQQRED